MRETTIFFGRKINMIRSVQSMYVCVPNNATSTKFVCRERVHYDENMTLRKNFYV